MNKNIFTYWEGPRPPYIQRCLEIMKGIGVQILDDTCDFVRNLHPNWKTLSRPAQRADAVRVAAIEARGGLWIDADTISTGLLSFFDKVDETVDLMYCRWSDKRVLNGYFYGKEHSPVMREWLKQINSLLSRQTVGLAWTSLGEGVLNPLINLRFKESCVEFSRSVFLPINIDQIPAVFFEPVSYKAFLKKDTIAIGLNHSWFCDHAPLFVQSSIETIVKTDTLIGGLFADY